MKASTKPAKKVESAAAKEVQPDLMPVLPAVISIYDLANCSNLTTRRLRQLEEDGFLPRIRKGVLPLVDALQRLFKLYQADDQKLAAEKLRQAEEKTKEMTRENLAAEGKLILREQADGRLQGHLRKLHQFFTETRERRDIVRRSGWLRKLGVPDHIVTIFAKLDIEQARKNTDEIELKWEAEIKAGLEGEGI